MIPVFHHCGLYIISNMEFLFFLGNQLVYLYRPTRKYTYQIIYLSSGDPRQREDQHQQVDHDGLRCEHRLILGSHLPSYTSLPAQVSDSMLRILSNILTILLPGQTICATSTPSLCSPLWLGAVLEK